MMIRNRRNAQLLTFIVILFILIIFVILQNNSDLANKASHSTSFKDPLVVNIFRNCSNSAFYGTDNHKKYIEKYEKCVDKFIPKLELDQFKMGRYGEIKYFVPLKSTFDQENCKWITVGIGGDVNVEKMFKEKYPGCTVFGVEPSPDQYKGFEKYGTVIPYGVGVENGTFELTLREGEKYVKKQVTVLAMSDLLDTYFKTRTVLYMTIDIEGFEYSILEELIEGKTLHNQGIEFCQIDAELHGFSNTMAKTMPLLHLFDSNKSPYLPVITKKFQEHRKVTFVNFRNPYCSEAFKLFSLFEE